MVDMQSGLFAVGSEIKIEYANSAGDNQIFYAVIEDAATHLVLRVTQKHRAVRLLPGQRVMAIQQAGRDVFVVSLLVLGSKGSIEPQLVLELPDPERIKREPRRRFFRVPVTMPFRWALGAGTIVDASANGFLLQTEDDCFKDGLEFSIAFDIPGGRKDVRARARVVRKFTRAEKHYTAVYISSIRPGMQDELIRYLLARQRELPR